METIRKVLEKLDIGGDEVSVGDINWIHRLLTREWKKGTASRDMIGE